MTTLSRAKGQSWVQDQDPIAPWRVAVKSICSLVANGVPNPFHVQFRGPRQQVFVDGPEVGVVSRRICFCFLKKPRRRLDSGNSSQD